MNYGMCLYILPTAFIKKLVYNKFFVGMLYTAASQKET